MTRSHSDPDRWSWATGEKGSNRVRVFVHPKSGRLFLEWFEKAVLGNRPKARTRALGHVDREQAKADAEEWALRLRRGEVPRSTPGEVQQDSLTLTRPIRLGPLFDMYLREVTPRKSRADHDQMAAALFVQAFGGRERIVDSLCERDWQRFIERRRSGQVAPRGREGKRVGNRVIEHDLRFLLAVLNWATKQKDAAGAFWLVANPVRGQTVPVEKNPRQPMITQEQYLALLKVAPKIDPRFHLSLVLAHTTGHRINSIRQLRWSDVDLDAREVSWRAETDKSGKAHVTPLNEEAITLLRDAALLAAPPRPDGQLVDGWLFPSAHTSQAIGRSSFQNWWGEAAREAKLELPKGCRFHAFRRKLATELVTEQLAVIKALGGWSQPHVVVSRYQKVSVEVQRDVLSRRQIR